jgi:hypothetical protein
MTLYLHIGTNKTGSSFLQSSLLLNVPILENSGFYLPPSQWDGQMRDGIITPGNGHELAKLLSAENADGLRKYLKQLVVAAERRQADKLILSNEVLIRLFSNPAVLQQLENIAQKVGIHSINCLCFLRNPYQHALSLYKHRAKSGQFPNYTSWFEHDYETLRLFKSFLDHFRRFSMKWTFRIYQPDSDYLVHTFYREFLQFDRSVKYPEKKINTSLTLNDIRLIGWMESLYRGIHVKLFPLLIAKKTKTEENPFLEANFFEVAACYLKAEEHTLKQLGKNLPAREQSLFFQEPAKKAQRESDTIDLMLSAEHLEIIRESRDWYQHSFLQRTGRKLYRRLLRGVRSWSSEKRAGFDNARYGGSLR